MRLRIDYSNVTDIFQPQSSACRIIPEVCILLQNIKKSDCCGGGISYIGPETILRALRMLSSMDKPRMEKLKQIMNANEIEVVYSEGLFQKSVVF